MGSLSNIREVVSERAVNERIKVYNSNCLRDLDEYTGRKLRNSIQWSRISSIDGNMVTFMGTIALNNKSYVEMHNGWIFSIFKKVLCFIIYGKRKE